MSYSFVKCLNPRHITNRYTCEEILIECGKCEACLMKKSLASVTRCKLESSSHRFTYFATLTYANEHLPLVQLVECDKDSDFDKYDVIEDDGTILGTVTFTNYSDKMMLLKKCKTSHNRLPYLRRKDCQLFVKRLRKYLNKFTNEKIRVFYCGEYGPVHFRPHFHLLLWFESEKISEVISEAVHSCWSYGRVDCQISSGKSSSYVASYLNGNCYLPKVFRLAGTKPFSNHSIYLGEQIFQTAVEEFKQDEFERIAKKRFYGAGINTDCILWRSLKARLLPKCQGFNQKCEQERILSYQSYSIACRWFGETRLNILAQLITDYIKDNDFYHPIDEVTEFLQHIRYNQSYYAKLGNDTFKKIYPSITDYDKLKRSIYIELLCSRKFLRNICNWNQHLIPKYVRKLDEFYKYLDYENLKQQLEIEKQFSKTEDPDKIRFFHHNMFDVSELVELPEFKRFTSSKKDMFSSFMKHKELNDKNKIFLNC